eukprot:Skav214812  [mRNA]  locus=scaffold1934:69605:74282:+ [translate_table: standard]
MDSHRFDQWGVHYGAARALSEGLHVDLVIQEVDLQCIAVPHSKDLPQVQYICDFPVWASSLLRTGVVCTVCDFIIDKVGDTCTIRSRGSVLLPIIHPDSKACQIAEGFAGLGGWSVGSALCGKKVRLLVEIDPAVALTCSRNHDMLCFDINTVLTLMQSGNLPDEFVLIASMTDPNTFAIASWLGVDTWCCSPPCPPWSKAARQLGLSDDQGAVFASMLYLFGLAKVRAIVLENVPGISDHPHFPVLRTIMDECKLRLVLNSVDRPTPLIPVIRNRWLALLVRADIETDHSLVVRARNASIPATIPKVGKTCSMDSADCLQKELQQWESDQCIPSPDALEMLSNPLLLPLNQRVGQYKLLDSNQVLLLRTRTKSQMMPNVMAQHGSQHLLPEPFLAEKGLHAWLLDDSQVLRYVTPLEVAVAMGHPHTITLPMDFRDAWRLVGNTLAIPHSMLQCYRASVVLGTKGSFGCDLKGPLITRLEMSPTWFFDDDHSPARHVPVPTRQQFPLLSEWAHAVQMPPRGGIDHSALPEEITVPDGQILVRCCHHLHTWAAVCAADPNKNIMQILREVLPHASIEMVDKLIVNGNEARPHSIVTGVSKLDIVLFPRTFPRIIDAEFLPKPVAVEVDLTWKAADVIAFVATNEAVLPSRVALFERETRLDPETYVLCLPAVTFDAFLMPIVKDVKVVTQDAEVGSQVESLVDPDVPQNRDVPYSVRVAIGSKKWRTILTAMFDPCTPISKVIETMFAGVCLQGAPRFVVKDTVVDNDVLLRDMLKHHVTMAIPGEVCSRDAFVALVRSDAVLPELELQTNIHVKVPTVRLPFLTTWESNMTIVEVAAFCFQHLSISLSLLPTYGGKSLDPFTRVGDLQGDMTLDFRPNALPGGTKSDVGIRKLREILLNRGVPSPAVEARVQLILGKINASELNTIMSGDDNQAWTALKRRASEAKLRMITVQELRDYQKMQRDLKKDQPSKDKTLGGKSASSGQKTRNNGSSRHGPGAPTKVTLDPVHFKAAGETPQVISVAQWGPDAKGIAMATVEEAQKFLPVTRLSADALALVIVTHEPFHGIAPTTIPAVDVKGCPVLTKVVILNFGDELVTCMPRLPSVALQEIPTAILEVVIQKKLVASWTDTRNVMNFLGVQLPELRSQQVISSWSFATFNDSKQKCSHDEATYIHGFIKVKTADRRYDPNYGVVIMHNSTIEEMIKLSKSIRACLGIVQVGHNGPFALRSKREDLGEVRRAALPQCISLQEGNAPSEGTWWLLKNLRASTTCAQLTEALKAIPWDANAIRPAGRASWIVCAKDEPPASHLGLGSELVTVVPFKSNPVTPSGPAIPVDAKMTIPRSTDSSMCPEDDEHSEATTVASRLSDLKYDMEVKLTTMMNERIKACDDRIAQVAASVETVKSDVVAVATSSKAEFAQLRTQQSEIQSQIEGNNNNLLKQMQSMFQTMQNDIKATLASGAPAEGAAVRSRSRSKA